MSTRWPTLPDVPTVVEAGVKDFVVTSWAAFVFPAGAGAIASTPEEALAYAARERAVWKDVVAMSGARAE